MDTAVRPRFAFWASLVASLSLHAVGGAALLLTLPAARPPPAAVIEVTLLETIEADATAGDAAPAAPPAAAPEPEPRASPPPPPEPEPRRAPAPRPAAASPQPAPPREVPPAPPAAEARPPEPTLDVAAAPSTDGTTGTPLQTAALADGAGAGADGTEDLEARITAYVEQVRERIAGRRRYPALARRRGVAGTVVALLVIGADGQLLGVELDAEAPSLLGAATREAIVAAAPFGAPPPGLRRIRVPVRYALED